MSVAPDTYLPAVWSLDDANVQAIESSATDPKTRLDSTGLFLTDGSGNKVLQIRGPAGAIDLLSAPAATPPVERTIRWVRSLDGTLVAYLHAHDTSGVQQVFLEAVKPATSAHAGFNAVTGGVGPTEYAEVHASHNAALGQSRIVISSDGTSEFLQLKTIANLQLQAFSVTLTNIPVGITSQNVNLPIAWPNSHFLATGTTAVLTVNNNLVIAQIKPFGLNQIQLIINNPTNVQDLTVALFSFGN